MKLPRIGRLRLAIESRAAAMRTLWRSLWVMGVVALGLRMPDALAERAWFDGVPVPVYGMCWSGLTEIISQNTVGYWTDPDESYPKTGDIAYVRASSTNISSCNNDTVGLEFFLPDGAELAVSTANPVRCYRVNLSDGSATDFTKDAIGECGQVPSTGAYGGYFFGFSAIPSGGQLQIHVPVRFNKQLLGLGGGHTHRLQAASVTTWGTVVPEQPVTVFYEADFLNTAANGITGTGATVEATLYSYFKGGLLYVDYGTSNAFGTTSASIDIPDADLGYGVFNNLTGLAAGTMYYWRYRFVTDSGTFVSPAEVFTTTGGSVAKLTVTKSGTGSGTVSSNPAAISCGNTCSFSFPNGTQVTLTAKTASGSVFTGWSGSGCSGTGTCSVAMTAARSVVATFNSTVIRGTSGPDTLQGTPLADILDGKGDADIMYGLGGNDTYVVDNADDQVIEGTGEGTDTMKSSVTYKLPANMENLTLTGTAAINGTGNGLANKLTGNAAANMLNGGAGNDRLVGGAGNDTFTGGTGKDSFLFNAALGSTNVDKLTDFVPADDTLKLENTIFMALTATGTLRASAFKIGTAASTAAHRIIYDPASGALYYDPDGSGSMAKVRFATLTNKPTLTNADFVVQ